jgi:Mg-chelatase subunit ChlD
LIRAFYGINLCQNTIEYCNSLIPKIMKYTYYLSIIILFFYQLSYSQADNDISRMDKKSMYDITTEDDSQYLKSGSLSDSRKLIRTQDFEYSLMSRGYFTLGTSNGISEMAIDDNCEITFGHPYSMTSFAYPIVDGERILPIEQRPSVPPELIQSGDTLRTTIKDDNQLHFVTSIYKKSENLICLQYQVINHDDISHQVAAGLFFDVALGRWGDGFVDGGNGVIDTITTIIPEIDESLFIRERKDSDKGIGLRLEFGADPPARISVGNWIDEYKNNPQEEGLYDLAIHSRWEGSELASGDTLGFIQLFALVVPEAEPKPFIRWDLPSSFSIENNLLFPSGIITNVEIVNCDESGGSFELSIPGSENVYDWLSEDVFTLNCAQSYHYHPAKLNIPEIYDSIVIPVRIQLIESGVVADELIRNVFIPAAPYSDEGLDISIDTSYEAYGKVHISFRALNSETRQILYSLHKNNVTVFDNNIPLEDFEMARDTSGGITNTDLIFVLDVTGSMAEEIAGVRDNIIEFTDSLSYRGIDFRLGMVTFLDVIENVYDFTTDVQEFQMNVAAQYSHGGADRPENSLEALSVASQFSFRENANRVIIWITDADYHISDDVTQLTKQAVIDQLLAVGVQTHCIGNTTFKTDFYDQIIMNTGGSFFDINGNFRDILLEVSRGNQATNHLVSFYRSETVLTTDLFKIEVHYAGLGGYGETYIEDATKSYGNLDHTSIMIYPNPVDLNSVIRFSGSAHNTYEASIYNLNGQLIAIKTIGVESDSFSMNFSDLFNQDLLHPSNVYLLKIMTISSDGRHVDQELVKFMKY